MTKRQKPSKPAPRTVRKSQRSRTSDTSREFRGGEDSKTIEISDTHKPPPTPKPKK